MNIFVTSFCPKESAIVLPDRHITKMSVETCQMLSIVASKWYHNYGCIHRADGNPYNVEKGSFRNHPCTQWAAKSIHNASWLIHHGISLCEEFKFRYNKIHSSFKTLLESQQLFPNGDITKVTPFARAMPDIYKLDTNIDTFTAYKMYIASKNWVSSNYLKKPERKPEWIP